MSHRISSYMIVLGVLGLSVPTIGQTLDYCSFLGGSGDDSFRRMEVVTESSGDSFALIAGDTLTNDLPLPGLPAGQTGNFAAKLLLRADVPTEDGLKWVTSFGGGFIQGTAVDADGNFYVVGKTGILGFPTTDGTSIVPCGQPQERHCGNGRYVVKFAGDTGEILYSTILASFTGGNDHWGNGIAVRSEGGVTYVYVADVTPRPDSPLVTPGSIYAGGVQDVTVSKFSETGYPQTGNPSSPPLELEWGRFFGGSDWEYSTALAVDEITGDVWVAGRTTSTDFPTLGGFYPTHGAGEEAFLARFDGATGVRQYCTLVPALAAWSVAVDSFGLAYVTGETSSATGLVPDPPAPSFDDSYNGGDDAYLIIVDGSQFGPDSLEYGTYLGGSDYDRGLHVVLDAAGRPIVSMQTFSGDVPIPLVGGWDETANGQADNAFIVGIDPTVSGFEGMNLGTYFGGNRKEDNACVRLDGAGRICLGVRSLSKKGFNPTTPGAYDGSFSGNSDVIVACFLPTEPVPGILVSPTTGLETTEAGGTATFTVVLQTQPTAAVLVDVSTSDPSEGLVSAGAQGPGTAVTLTFTTFDWDLPQTVIVTGQDDTDPDGPVAYTLLVAPAMSTDLDYNGLDPDDVSATNLDDDQVGLTISGVLPPTMNAGSSVSMTVSGSGFLAGASVTFENGQGPAPVASGEAVTPTAITLTVTASNGGPGGTRTWDVRVTNPGGATAVLLDGFDVVK